MTYIRYHKHELNGKYTMYRHGAPFNALLLTKFHPSTGSQNCEIVICREATVFCCCFFFKCDPNFFASCMSTSQYIYTDQYFITKVEGCFQTFLQLVDPQRRKGPPRGFGEFMRLQYILRELGSISNNFRDFGSQLFILGIMGSLPNFYFLTCV